MCQYIIFTTGIKTILKQKQPEPKMKTTYTNPIRIEANSMDELNQKFNQLSGNETLAVLTSIRHSTDINNKVVFFHDQAKDGLTVGKAKVTVNKKTRIYTMHDIEFNVTMTQIEVLTLITEQIQAKYQADYGTVEVELTNELTRGTEENLSYHYQYRAETGNGEFVAEGYVTFDGDKNNKTPEERVRISQTINASQKADNITVSLAGNAWVNATTGQVIAQSSNELVNYFNQNKKFIDNYQTIAPDVLAQLWYMR
jgi:hypothetical protein